MRRALAFVDHGGSQLGQMVCHVLLGMSAAVAAAVQARKHAMDISTFR